MTLLLQNRQRARKINLRALRKITRYLLENLLEQNQFELAIHLVSPSEIAALNETFLQHHGPTDVISFDYGKTKNKLRGEIFICLEVAVKQARQFRATWPSELMRYIIHGILHLEGFDDLYPPARKQMKRRENLLLQKLHFQFSFNQLDAKKSSHK
ncbi:MAG: rRNA maturation RNase YbeY [Limisphaerales bacterium]